MIPPDTVQPINSYCLPFKKTATFIKWWMRTRKRRHLPRRTPRKNPWNSQWYRLTWLFNSSPKTRENPDKVYPLIPDDGLLWGQRYL